MALEKSKSQVFTDSDSDSENDERSSAGDASTSASASASQQSSSTFGTADPIAALSAVSKVFHSGRKADAAGASATAAAATMATPSPPLPPASSSSSAAVVSPAEADPGAKLSAPSPAAAAAAPARLDAKNSVVDVEPSSAPRVSVQALPSTSTMSQASTKAGPAAGFSATATAGGLGGGVRGRPSTLGRPGMAPAKVTMPIAGGRAAWNKFLASTATGESAPGAAGGASTAEASAGGGGGGSGSGSGGQRTDAGASTEGGSEDGDSTAADFVEEQDEILARRGPRGFNSAADSQQGPNKGPAGAFSGNAMWRLAAGASSAANRARSGVAANGHGGYSNPLAAMRAGGGNGTAAAGAAGGTDGALGVGGSVANPLAGLRGAASIGGAGAANPLVRGRGARPGGAAGGIANPMLRAGGTGGTANPLARGSAASGGVMSSVPSASGPATKAAMPSGGVTASAASSAEGEGEATTVAAWEITSAGGTDRAVMEGAIDLDRPTEFRAIGNNGSWHKGGIPVPPRRSRRAEPQVEADPGQAKVGGLVVSVAVFFVFFFFVPSAHHTFPRN